MSAPLNSPYKIICNATYLNINGPRRFIRITHQIAIEIKTLNVGLFLLSCFQNF